MSSAPTAMILSQLWNLPAILLAIVGIVIALARWKKHPTVSLVALIAFGLLLGTRLLSAALFAFQYWQISSNSFSGTGSIFGIVQSLLVLFGFLSQVLMIIAIFGWRAPAPASPTMQ